MELPNESGQHILRALTAEEDGLSNKLPSALTSYLGVII